MQISFEQQVVIVTGAAHGFGRAIALAFAARGAHVWGCDVLEEELAVTQQQADGLSGRIIADTVDVSEASQVAAFVNKVKYTSGRIDVLVNNAGGVLGQPGRALEAISDQDWRSIFAVNVDGAFYFARAVAPGMKAARYGRIVNISSGAGLGISLTGIQAYASAKAAQLGLTRQLAHELGPWNITVNAVAPGFVRSNPTTEKQWRAYGQTGQRELIEAIALKRLGSPEDIAYGVLFLASKYASWISGQVLAIDGGR